MNTDDIIEMITLVILLGLFMPVTLMASKPLYRGDFGGFGTIIEKTALSTNGDKGETENVYERCSITDEDFTSADALLILCIADEYTPDPKIIEIQGTEINIDSSFLDNRLSSLVNAYDAMTTTDKMTLELYVGPSGVRKWVINYQ